MLWIYGDPNHSKGVIIIDVNTGKYQSHIQSIYSLGTHAGDRLLLRDLRKVLQ